MGKSSKGPDKPKKPLSPTQSKLSEYLLLMEKENLHELEVSDGDFHVKLVRQSKNLAPVILESSSGSKLSSHENDESEPAAPAIHAPLAGIFYRARSPESPPFIEEGQRVTPDTTVCIVEAMKVMNEIKAEMSGIVKKVLVENAKPVSKDQPIILIDPS